MKRLFTVLLISIAAFACDNDCNCDVDEYYVKYDAVASSIHSDSKLIEVTITNEDGNKETFEGRSIEMIIGPVKQGFNAELDVNSISTAVMQLYLEISVSKNDGPFASKEVDGSDQNRESAYLNYIVE